MQGSSRPDREVLDAAALCAHLVPDGSVYAFLAEHRTRLFPDEMFVDLFPTNRGRPSVPADVIATVMVCSPSRRCRTAKRCASWRRTSRGRPLPVWR
jgi:hypothetical protein